MKYENKEAFEKANIFGTGAANTAYARFFIGDSFLNPLTDPKSGLFAANVTFEPGCRNNWHIHHATSGGGQLLICTAGERLVSGRGQGAREPSRGQRCHDSRRGEALARREEGQLVQSYSARGARRELPQRMVRAGD